MRCHLVGNSSTHGKWSYVGLEYGNGGTHCGYSGQTILFLNGIVQVPLILFGTRWFDIVSAEKLDVVVHCSICVVCQIMSYLTLHVGARSTSTATDSRPLNGGHKRLLLPPRPQHYRRW